MGEQDFIIYQYGYKMKLITALLLATILQGYRGQRAEKRF